MITCETMQGKPFANDPQYDAVTGRVTYQSEVVGITLDGWKVKRTVSYIDIGRAAPIDAVDPDIQMRRERFTYDNPNRGNAVDGLAKVVAKRAQEFIGTVEACLREHGPMSATNVSRHLGHAGVNVCVQSCLRDNADRFVFRGGAKKVWSLVGQEYAPPPKMLSEQAVAIREAILAHGPQMSRDIAKCINRGQSSVDERLKEYPDYFCVVGMAKSPGNGIPTRVWGLVEAQVTQ